jgi:hypothetical protein
VWHFSADIGLYLRALLLDYREDYTVPIADKDTDNHTAEAVPVVPQRLS